MSKTLFFPVLCVLVFCEAHAQGAWIQKANFGGTGRAAGVGFSIGNKGYIGLGYDGTASRNDLWEYDPQNDSWSQKANFGGTGRSDATGFSIGTRGYVGTGPFTLKDFWQYEWLTNTWTKKADFGGVGRYGAVGFSIGSKGYIGTGASTTTTYYKDFWEYDTTSNAWTQKASFPGTQRMNAVGFSIGQYGYIGLGYDGAVKNDFWRWKQSDNTWSAVTAFPGLGRQKPAGFSIGTKGFIACGRVSTNTFYKDFWEYDTLTGNWTQKPDYAGSGRDATAGFSIGSKGYVGAGEGGWTGPYHKDFWVYCDTCVSTTAVYDGAASQNLLTIYPNPFSCSANLKTGQTVSDPSITLYDCGGRLVKKLSASKIGPHHPVTLYREDLEPGLYFIQISENDRTVGVQKLIIQK